MLSVPGALDDLQKQTEPPDGVDKAVVLDRLGDIHVAAEFVATIDLARVIREIKGGRVEFRVDKTGVIHAPIGKVSFTPDQLTQNLAALLDAVQRAKPTGVKGQYIRGITLASTMGPGVHLDIQPALGLAASQR